MNCDMIYLVKDDNGSQLQCLLTREDTDLPINLAGAVARLKFRKKRTKDILFTLTNITALDVDLAGGEALFQFSASNLNLPAGVYEGEVEITFGNSNIETVYELIEFTVRDDF